MHNEGTLFGAVWRFLRPQAEELIIYFIVCLFLAGVAVYSLANSGSLGSDTQDVVTAAQNIIGQATAYMSTGSGWAKFFLFGFWFIMGTLAYLIIWSTYNIFIDIRNDIEFSAAFVHPRSFHQSDYWASVVGRIVLRTGASIALVFYGVFWAWIIAPIGAGIVKSATTAHNPFLSALDVVWLLVLVCGSLHIGTILLKVALLRSRFF